MKFKKRLFNYNIEEVIKLNLAMQTTCRVLQNEFGFKDTDFNALIRKGLSHYNIWPEEKRNRFISTIGGKANFKKTKAYLESKIG